MISLLLTVSFLIHILTLLGMYYLYKELQLHKTKKENTQVDDIAALFEGYLDEIKTENTRLESKVIEDATSTKIHSYPDASKSIIPTIHTDHFSPNELKIEDELKTTLESKVLQLYSQGYTSDEIAKQLNCGKTETTLIIKLHHKNKS